MKMNAHEGAKILLGGSTKNGIKLEWFEAKVRKASFPNQGREPKSANSKAAETRRSCESRDCRSRTTKRTAPPNEENNKQEKAICCLRPKVDHVKTHEAHTKRKPWILKYCTGTAVREVVRSS